MKNIIVVDALSTGYNLIEDIHRRGYRPVVLEPHTESAEMAAMYQTCYDNCYRMPEIIKEAGPYEQTLEKVKAYDPVLVLAGSENGVPLATRLADDLRLPGNPWKNIDKMTRKDAMQEALKDAGLRYIRWRRVNNARDALAFCRENGLNTAVVKPIRSAGSMGVYLCDTLAEVEAAVEQLTAADTLFGGKNTEVLVQERIHGVEYIVNTVTSNGVHRMNSMFRYSKTQTREGGNIYDYIESINRLEPGHSTLIGYALKVAEAIGMRYGIIHGEYMVDEKGPVLIEVNCRPMGASLPAEFMDLIFGQHETDAVLDALLDPAGFARNIDRPYRPLRKGIVKYIMVPENMDADDHPIWQVARQLRSVHRILAHAEDLPKQYVKTQDLETAGGAIYMVHDDENVVMSDLALLKDVERNHFQLLLNDGTSRRWFRRTGAAPVDCREVLRRNDCHGSILIAGDEPGAMEGAQVVTPETLADAHRGFDCVVVAYQDSLTALKESACLKLLFDTVKLTRPGGRVIIPPDTYQYLTNGRMGAEELLCICRFLIEASVSGEQVDVIGVNL